MGKETESKVKQFAPSPPIHSGYSKASIASEASLLWNINNIWNSEEIKESGIAYISLKEGNRERQLTLRGFAARDNKVQEIFRQLLIRHIISSETKLLSFK
eukprot:TRINITY_DN1775_c0_g1_i1.p1 TRINITY_DN1775_c0_g1~~TRINITY_DN1775_c0_g1_i1.p1  ORF type:complete len:101 (-),score=29.95 TRINITY_DN1775_c0_g1_i1:247-549(-)